MGAESVSREIAHWIKHDKGYWRGENEKGRTDWYTFLIPPEVLVGSDAKITWLPDYECSSCGSRGWSWANNIDITAMNYCPYCGAQMEVSEV